MDLNGKTAIVTGGTKGIGRAIAEGLIDEGISVCISARNQDEIDQAVKDLNRSAGARAIGFTCDVRDHGQVKALIDHTVKELGGLDILINNAGIGIFAEVAEMTPEQWAEVIDTNLTGVFNACHAAIPQLRRRDGGFIINISSLAGRNSFASAASYCASKAGLNAFSEALMQEVRYDGIRVSYVMPGSVATAFGRGGDQSMGADWKIAPEEVAEVVLNLLRHDRRSLPSRVELRPSKPRKP